MSQADARIKLEGSFKNGVLSENPWAFFLFLSYSIQPRRIRVLFFQIEEWRDGRNDTMLQAKI